MQTGDTTRHSSFANLRPYECAIKFKNRDLLIRCAGAALAAGLTLVACWPYVLGEADWTRLLFAIPIVVACVALEYLFIIRSYADFQGIVTHDCDPAKMLKVEDHLLGRIKNRRAKAQHMLIASQAAMLTGDVEKSRELLNVATATAKPSGAMRPMVDNVGIGFATIEKDWPQVRSLRDDLAASLRKSRGPLREGAEMALLFTDEALAVADGDLQAAEELLDRLTGLAKLPEQQTSVAFRRAELEVLKGDDAAARPYYEQAKSEGGTCYFAHKAAEWLATHQAGIQ